MNTFMLYRDHKFMLYQDLSVVPLFPSPHTVRSYHHLRYSLWSLLPANILIYKAQKLAMLLSLHRHTGGSVTERRT